MMAQVDPGWSLQELILNTIHVTYQAGGLLITPRHNLKLPVNRWAPFPTRLLEYYHHVATKGYPPSLMCNSSINQIDTKVQPYSQSNAKHDLPTDTSHN
jgi:hypothetical protein